MAFVGLGLAMKQNRKSSSYARLAPGAHRRQLSKPDTMTTFSWAAPWWGCPPPHHSITGSLATSAAFTHCASGVDSQR